jgi:kynurenine formamidase
MLSNFQFEYQQKIYQFNPLLPLDIAWELKKGNQNPKCYYAQNPDFLTIRMGSFVGSVKEGGSCNYQTIFITPHGNGTHTECYGHITGEEEATMTNCLKKFLFFAELISVTPQKIENDHIILWKDIEKQLTTQPQALILRTLPNERKEKLKDYSNTNPPYLEAEIGKKLAEKNILHLLLDLPSVDKEVDGGKLACHHAFWQYPHNTRKEATITELIFVKNQIKDGIYLLNLQVPSIAIDAVPSKPILYALQRY